MNSEDCSILSQSWLIHFTSKLEMFSHKLPNLLKKWHNHLKLFQKGKEIQTRQQKYAVKRINTRFYAEIKELVSKV